MVEIASPSPEITGGFDDAELPWLELVVQLKLRKLVDERVTVAGVCSRCRELGFDLHNHVGLGTNFSTVQEILMREALALQGWGKIIEIAAGGARKDGAERYFGMDRWVDWCIEDEGKLPEVAEALMKACGWMRVSVGSYNDLAAEGSRVISIVDRMKVKLAIWRAKEQYNAVPNVDSDGVRRIAVVTEAKAREVED